MKNDVADVAMSVISFLDSRGLICDKSESDAVSRKAVHDMLENLPITVEDKWFNWLQKACMRLAELPPVTPTRPKGKWIRWQRKIVFDDCSTSYIPHCKCSECAVHYNPHSSRFMNFCPHCGADMREGET